MKRPHIAEYPYSLAPIAEAQPGITVADAVARLRCSECGEPPEIVALSRPSVGQGGPLTRALRAFFRRG